MEIEFLADSIDEKTVFQTRYLSKMVNFTGNAFGCINEQIATSFVEPDFRCVKVSYDAGQDIQIIQYEKAEIPSACCSSK